MQRSQQRHIPIPQTYNVRDLGGYPTRGGGTTRWHTFYRSDNLHLLDGAGVQMVLDLGVRRVFDLRHGGETGRWPNKLAAHEAVTYENLPLTSENPAGAEEAAQRRRVQDLEASYRQMLDQRGPELLRLFSAFADAAQRPVLFHCTAGKDRTGVVAGLLLSFAGVDEATIAEDYALTQTLQNEVYLAGARQRAELAGVSWDEYRQLLVSPPEYMLRTLAYLGDRYGSAEKYLVAIGLSDAQLQALREAIIEE